MKKLFSSGLFMPLSIQMNLKMKLSFLLLFMIAFMMRANLSYSQNTKISLEIDNATIAQVIDEIEATTEFKFLYNVKEVATNRRVSLNVKKKKIDFVLNELFNKTNTTYKIENKKVLLFERSVDVLADENSTDAQSQLQIIGTINDSEGVPLIGANVIEKGTTNGTQTDFDGNFTLEVTDANAILVISYIGFLTQEIAL
ncbi:MAG: carboxypeptidase-like regulatory domain-containing protein, partial [Flavobacteriaceae bacterium]